MIMKVTFTFPSVYLLLDLDMIVIIVGAHLHISLFTRSEKDCNLFLVIDRKQAAQDKELLDMDLVPHRRGPVGAEGAPHSAQQRVLGFFYNFKRDPYTTAASALSKFYDAVCKLFE